MGMGMGITSNLLFRVSCPITHITVRVVTTCMRVTRIGCSHSASAGPSSCTRTCIQCKRVTLRCCLGRYEYTCNLSYPHLEATSAGCVACNHEKCRNHKMTDTRQGSQPTSKSRTTLRTSCHTRTVQGKPQSMDHQTMRVAASTNPLILQVSAQQPRVSTRPRNRDWFVALPCMLNTQSCINFGLNILTATAHALNYCHFFVPNTAQT